MSKEPTLGEKGTLYIDTRNDRIFEKGEVKTNIFIGIVFICFGLLALVATIMGIIM